MLAVLSLACLLAFYAHMPDASSAAGGLSREEILEAMIKEELFGMSQEEIATGEQCTVMEESSGHELAPQEMAELDIEVELYSDK